MIAVWGSSDSLRSIWRQAGSNDAVVFEKGDRTWSAYVPDLPGCVATSATRKKAEAMIREAIAFSLEGMRLQNLAIPASISTAMNLCVSA